MSKSKMPQPGFILNFCLKCSLQISAAILFLVEELEFFFTFYLECNSCVCLPFRVGNYPQWKQAVAFHWHFCYQLVAWMLVFNHTVIILYIDSVAFLYQLSNAQQIMFQTFNMIDNRNKITLPCLVRIPTIPFSKTLTLRLFPSVTSV